MAADDKDEDLMTQGLVGRSYDHLFAIRKRVRKLGDLVIPLRGGLTYAQIGTAVVTFIFSFIIYAIVVLPILTAAHPGPLANLVVMLLTLFGPPILVAQRAVAPMPNGKTINGYVLSLLRFTLDDKVYRRGRPIDPPTTHQKGLKRHDWLVWEPGVEFAETLGDDLALTREDVERSFTGDLIDLTKRQQEVSAAHLAVEKADAEREAVTSVETHDLRHTDASGVIGL